MTKRRFVDAPDTLRCKAVVRLKDGTTAQCGRYMKVQELCRQHAKKYADRKESFPHD